jgi:hypothetical protein
MSRPESARQDSCFIPPAAQLNAAAGIFCVIFGIAATLLSWLCFETHSPAIALGCGISAGGLLLVADHWRRQKFAPPILRWNANVLILEKGGLRTVVSWTDIAEIRHLDLEIETIELRKCSCSDPIVIVLDHFSPEQALEIRSELLGRAA